MTVYGILYGESNYEVRWHPCERGKKTGQFADMQEEFCKAHHTGHSCFFTAGRIVSSGGQAFGFRRGPLADRLL